jgi:hypothetical protein
MAAVNQFLPASQRRISLGALAAEILLELSLVAGLALGIGELATGTSALFALLSCLYLLIGCQIYNTLGGGYRITGGGVAALFVVSFLLPVLGKLALWQACDSYLYAPVRTLSVYVLGALGMWWAAYLTRAVRPVRSLAWRWFGKQDLLLLGVAAYVMGSAGNVLYLLHMREIMDRQKGGIGPISASLAPIINLAVACSVANCIRKSNGAKSVDWFAAIAILTSFGFAFLDVGKAAMFAPLITYALTCFANRFRMNWKRSAVWAVCLLLMAEVIFPFAQIARTTVRVRDLGDRLHLLNRSMSDIGSVPNLWRRYRSVTQTDHHYQFDSYYGYGRTMGFLDRMNMLKFDDYLISGVADTGAHTGWNSLSIPFRYLIPSAVFKHKPEANSGNFLGHFTGTIADKDLITQITFTLMADSYASMGWLGVAFLPFSLCLVFFLTYDALFGSISESVWCIALFGYILFHFSENFIGFLIFDIVRVPIVMLCTGSIMSLVAWLTGAILGKPIQ